MLVLSMKKKIISVFLLLLLLVLLPVEAFGAIYVPEKLDAEVVYMISLDNDAVIVNGQRLGGDVDFRDGRARELHGL